MLSIHPLDDCLRCCQICTPRTPPDPSRVASTVYASPPVVALARPSPPPPPAAASPCPPPASDTTHGQLTHTQPTLLPPLFLFVAPLLTEVHPPASPQCLKRLWTPSHAPRLPPAPPGLPLHLAPSSDPWPFNFLSNLRRIPSTPLSPLCCHVSAAPLGLPMTCNNVGPPIPPAPQFRALGFARIPSTPTSCACGTLCCFSLGPQMTSNNVGALLVLKGGAGSNLAGIITERGEALPRPLCG